MRCTMPMGPGASRCRCWCCCIYRCSHVFLQLPTAPQDTPTLQVVAGHERSVVPTLCLGAPQSGMCGYQGLSGAPATAVYGLPRAPPQRPRMVTRQMMPRPPRHALQQRCRRQPPATMQPMRSATTTRRMYCAATRSVVAVPLNRHPAVTPPHAGRTIHPSCARSPPVTHCRRSCRSPLGAWKGVGGPCPSLLTTTTTSVVSTRASLPSHRHHGDDPIPFRGARTGLHRRRRFPNRRLDGPPRRRHRAGSHLLLRPTHHRGRKCTRCDGVAAIDDGRESADRSRITRHRWRHCLIRRCHQSACPCQHPCG